jgi:hypothetical protein
MRSDLRTRPMLVSLILAVIMVAAAVLIGGCGPYLLPVTPSELPDTKPPVVHVPTAPVAPVTDDPEEITVDQLWQTSAHGDSYVSGDPDNNACAKCHAPWNYLPSTSAELPKDCLSCKFTLPAPESIPADKWTSIPCDICHKVTDGAADPAVYWVNAIIIDFSDEDPYEPMDTSTELCVQCHKDEGDFNYARDMGSQLHQDKECADCHDSHGLSADCTTCHEDALTPTNDNRLAHGTPGHEKVSCAACHDAAGLVVEPGADGIWQPQRDTAMRGAAPDVSHDLQRVVDCARCHYTGNSWGLTPK